MADTATRPTVLEQQIIEALAELRGAREIFTHSPTGENQHMIDLCDWRLDVLLARQSATTKAEQMVSP